MFTRAQLTRLMLPLIIEQLLAVTVGVADTIMITAVGESAVSGVSFVDTINALVIYMLSALATGGAIVVSQYLGRDNIERAENASRQLMYTVFFSAFVFSLFCFFFRRPILNFLFGSVESSVMEAAVIYLAITSCSFPFLAIYNACAAVFRSMGNSKVSLYASLLMNIVNVGGNAFLIYYCNWGIAGAATATLISRALSSFLLVYLLSRKGNKITIHGMLRIRIDFKTIRSILRVGIPSGLESGIFHIGKLLVQSLLAGLSTSAIAANAICISIVNYLVIPGGAMGLGLITVTGQCIGAGKYDQVRYYVSRLMLVIFGFMSAIGILLYILEKPMFGIFGLSSEALEVAYFLFPGLLIAHITLWPYAFPFANVLRAAGDVKFTMAVAITTMWTIRIGMANVFIRYLGMGPEGMWYAMYIDFFVRSVIFLWRYKSGKWMDKRVIEPS